MAAGEEDQHQGNADTDGEETPATVCLMLLLLPYAAASAHPRIALKRLKHADGLLGVRWRTTELKMSVQRVWCMFMLS